MNKLEVGMYVRFKDKKGATYIRKLTKLANEYPQKLYGMEIDEEANYSPYLSLKNILKASHSIIDLIEPMDLMYIDISPDDCGGIVVPRVVETLNELEKWKKRISSGDCVLKGIVTKEQLKNMEYRIGD